MKKPWSIITASILVLLCMAGTASAATDLPDSPELPTAIQITKDNDVSASFLSNLIGPSWQEIAGGAAVDDLGGMGRYHGLLIGFLGLFNLAAMTFVSVAIMYYWGVFAVTTAHEGKSIGGSVYNSLWVPVRHAVSFSFTVPVLNGLSLLQVAILGCVSLSINFANIAWDWAGQYIVQNSQSGIIDNSPPLIEDESLTLIQPLFQAVTVSEFLRQRAFVDEGDFPHINQQIKARPLPARVEYADGGWDEREYKSVEIARDSRWVIVREPLAGAITVYPMPGRGMPLGQLGAVTIAAPVQTHDVGVVRPLSATGRAMQQIAEARAVAIMDAGDDLRQAAKAYLWTHQLVNDYLGPQAKHKSGTQIAREYRQKINSTTMDQAEVIKEGNDAKGLLESAVDSKDGKARLGWASAGLFSTALAQRQREIDDMVYGGSARFEFPDMDFPDQGLIGDMQRFFGSGNTALVLDYGAKLGLNGAANWAANVLMEGRVYSSKDKTGDGPGIVNKFLAATFVGGTGADGLVATTLSKLRSHDPIVVLSDFGSRAWTAAAWLAGASMAAGFAGVNTAAVAGGMLALFAIGLTLKIVAPLTPVSIWLYALLHWIIRVLEALLAAPFWAVMHMMPEGHGFAGNAARKGYTLLLDILARPVLLVAGACASIAIWLGAAQIFSMLFARWLNSYTGYAGAGLITEIAVVAVLLIFFYYLYTKLFVLMVSTLPDRLMNWIGGPSGGFGGEEASGTAPLAASGAAAAKGGSMLGAAVGGLSGATSKLYDRKKKGGDNGNDNPKADLPNQIAPKDEG